MFRSIIVVGCMSMLIGCGGEESAPAWGTSMKGDDGVQTSQTTRVEERHVWTDGDACEVMKTLFHLHNAKQSTSTLVAAENSKYNGATTTYTLRECSADKTEVTAAYSLKSGEKLQWKWVVGKYSSFSFGGSNQGTCEPKNTAKIETMNGEVRMTETIEISLVDSDCMSWLQSNTDRSEQAEQAAQAAQAAQSEQVPKNLKSTNTYATHEGSSQTTVESTSSTCVRGDGCDGGVFTKVPGSSSTYTIFFTPGKG